MTPFLSNALKTSELEILIFTIKKFAWVGIYSNPISSKAEYRYSFPDYYFVHSFQ